MDGSFPMHLMGELLDVWENFLEKMALGTIYKGVDWMKFKIRNTSMFRSKQERKTRNKFM
jgi:hypothetical protein